MTLRGSFFVAMRTFVRTGQPTEPLAQRGALFVCPPTFDETMQSARSKVRLSCIYFCTHLKLPRFVGVVFLVWRRNTKYPLSALYPTPV